MFKGKKHTKESKEKINIQPGTFVTMKYGKVIPVTSLDNLVLGVMGSKGEILSTSTVYATTGSTWTTMGEGPKRKKQIFRCDECGKKLTEYYANMGPYHFDSGEKVLCKTCHQIDKLKE